MSISRGILEQGLGRPLANIGFAMMQGYVRSVRRRGVSMLHTARPFSFYRKVFYRGRPASAVLAGLQGKRIVDVGCGYTPYTADSMFRACNDAEIEFYGVDPVISPELQFGFRERALSRITGGSGVFRKEPLASSRALCARAEDMPFDNNSVDEILSAYLLFVWIEDETLLAKIFTEFLRVLKPGGVVRLYPLFEWRFMQFENKALHNALDQFTISQRYLNGLGDWRVPPSMVTEFQKI